MYAPGRALAINEAAYGPEHPTVAIHLNNLASLLQATHRLTEAEPLYQRTTAILHRFQLQTGHAHPRAAGTDHARDRTIAKTRPSRFKSLASNLIVK